MVSPVRDTDAEFLFGRIVPRNMDSTGVNSSTQWLQEAIDRSASMSKPRPVQVPPGIFRLEILRNPEQGQKDYAILQRPFVPIYGSGQGRTVFIVPQHNVTAFAMSTDFHFRDFTIVGSGHPTYGVPNWQTVPNAQGKLAGLQSGFDSGAVHNGVIEYVDVFDMALHGIKISDNSRNHRIFNCRIENTGDEGIVTLNRSDHIWIERCTIKNCGKNGIGVNGAHLNIIGNYGDGNGWLGRSPEEGGINWASDCHNCLAWQHQDVFGADISYIIIADNQFKNPGGVNILYEAPSNIVSRGGIVSRNICVGGRNGMIIGSQAGMQVVDNIVRNAWANGIVLRIGEGSRISRNDVRTFLPLDASTDQNYQFAGILQQFGAEDTEYAHNTVRGYKRSLSFQQGAVGQVVHNDLEAAWLRHEILDHTATSKPFMNKGYTSEAGGVHTETAVAGQTVMRIPHGLGSLIPRVPKPGTPFISPANPGAANAPRYSLTATDTHLVLTFVSALVTGLTYQWNWSARLTS